jgi:hypothetical protein
LVGQDCLFWDFLSIVNVVNCLFSDSLLPEMGFFFFYPNLGEFNKICKYSIASEFAALNHKLCGFN